MTSDFLESLRRLAALKNISLTSNRASNKLLLLAFKLPKPLTSDTDRAEATSLFVNSLPMFSESLQRLNIRLEPELVDTAQRTCSGLHYIIEELNQSENPQLKSLLDFPVADIKEYIKSCKELDIQPEYPSVDQSLTSEELSKIPKSHLWWFVTLKADSDSDE